MTGVGGKTLGTLCLVEGALIIVAVALPQLQLGSLAPVYPWLLTLLAVCFCMLLTAFVAFSVAGRTPAEAPNEMDTLLTEHTVLCPHCGTRQSKTTEVCPRCEYRLAGPCGKDSAEHDPTRTTDLDQKKQILRRTFPQHGQHDDAQGGLQRAESERMERIGGLIRGLAVWALLRPAGGPDSSAAAGVRRHGRHAVPVPPEPVDGVAHPANAISHWAGRPAG
jgi:hypothetical protein